MKTVVSPSVAISVHEDGLPEVISEGKHGLIFVGDESAVPVTFKTDKYVSRSSNSTWNPVASCNPCLKKERLSEIEISDPRKEAPVHIYSQ